MEFENILNLAERAARGFDNFKKGSVGFNGYGFVLRDLSFPLSRKMCNFGSMRKFAEYLKHVHLSKESLQKYGIFRDLLLVGSIKTLLPSLELGGDEILFNAWMFVATTDGRKFPATLYYGSTRLAVGGWKSGGNAWFDGVSHIPSALKRIANCDPFKFSSIVKKEFVESLEHAIKKVPPSDFYAIFERDLGYRLMGISDGSPVSIELGETPTIQDVKLNISNFFGIKVNSEVIEKWDFR
jgi:hypothetical protein